MITWEFAVAINLQNGKEPLFSIRMHKSYSVNRKTFIFLHGVSKHKIHAIKEHFLDNGISPREHGNNGKQPKHSLSFKRIVGILQFIQNHAEQHAVLFLAVFLVLSRMM